MYLKCLHIVLNVESVQLIFQFNIHLFLILVTFLQ